MVSFTERFIALGTGVGMRGTVRFITDTTRAQVRFAGPSHTRRTPGDVIITKSIIAFRTRCRMWRTEDGIAGTAGIPICRAHRIPALGAGFNMIGSNLFLAYVTGRQMLVTVILLTVITNLSMVNTDLLATGFAGLQMVVTDHRLANLAP